MSTYVLIPSAGGMAWYWHRLVRPEERAERLEAYRRELPTSNATRSR